MNRTNRSTLEKTLAKKINSTKSKTQKPGYVKELVTKLYPEITAALDRGCDYSEIAKSMTTDSIKVSANTLKKYHNQNRTDKSQNQSQKSIPQDSQFALQPQKPKNPQDVQRQDTGAKPQEKSTQLQPVELAEPIELENIEEILSKNSDDLSRNFNHW